MVVLTIDKGYYIIHTKDPEDGCIYLNPEEAKELLAKLDAALWERDRQQSEKYQAGFTEDNVI